MADFFFRLAERTLGVAAVAKPAIAPMFAPGPHFATIPIETVPQRSETAAGGEPSAPPPAALETWKPTPEAPRPRRVVNERHASAIPEPAESGIVIARSEPAVTRGVTPVDNVVPERGHTERRPEAHEPSLQPLRPRMPTTAEAETPVAELKGRAAVAPAKKEPVEFKASPPARPHFTLPAVGRQEERWAPHRRRTFIPEERGGAAPTVRVSIGRIEVRAVFPETLAQPVQSPARNNSLSLSEYLAQRDRGVR
jgi:hypothetical protein